MKMKKMCACVYISEPIIYDTHDCFDLLKFLRRLNSASLHIVPEVSSSDIMSHERFY